MQQHASLGPQGIVSVHALPGGMNLAAAHGELIINYYGSICAPRAVQAREDAPGPTGAPSSHSTRACNLPASCWVVLHLPSRKFTVEEKSRCSDRLDEPWSPWKHQQRSRHLRRPACRLPSCHPPALTCTYYTLRVTYKSHANNDG